MQYINHEERRYILCEDNGMRIIQAVILHKKTYHQTFQNIFQNNTRETTLHFNKLTN